MDKRHKVIILKTTYNCNMRCIYCYHEESGYINKSMTPELLHRLVDLIIADGYRSVTYIFHGGEPLLLGIDFYNDVLNYIRNRHLEAGTSWKINIQSNLTLLNEDYIKLFHEFGMKVGFSFDGLTNEKTRGYTDLILEKLKLAIDYREQGMDIMGGCILMLNRYNYENIVNEIRYLDSLGLKILNVHLCFDQGAAHKMGQSILLTGDEMFEAYKNLFEYWLFNPGGINVANTERFVKMVLLKETFLCENTICNGKWIGVNPQGDVYMCGRWYDPKYSYGNIFKDDSISKMHFTPVFQEMLKQSNERRMKCMKDCEIFNLCRGGCDLIHLLYGSMTDVSERNIICQFTRKFLPYVTSRLKELSGSDSKYMVNTYKRFRRRDNNETDTYYL